MYSNIMQPENIVHNPIDSSHIIQVIFGLLIVLVLIALSAYFLRRFGKWQATANGALKILAGLSLGARERIVLLQVGETQLVVGISPGRIQTLCILDKPIPIQQAELQSRSKFADKLESILKGQRA